MDRSNAACARVASAIVLLVLASCDTSPSLPSVGTLDPLGFAQLKEFQAFRSSSNNTDPLSNDDSKRPIPGESIVLADLDGPGLISHIWLTVAGNEYGWPRLLRLRVYYDDSPVPSVDAPLGDFFGVGHGLERQVNSLLIRNASGGRSRNSYWPMPFRKHARVTITNEGRRRIYNLYYHVDWQKMPSLPANTAYFHARYRQALPAKAGSAYDFLRVTGQGFYVGTVLSAIQVQPGWFGEGDDLFYVDGNSKPAIEGTGTEDYVNDAWSLRVAEGPYAGVPVADGTDTGARMTAYRWHLTDPIPFTTSLRAAIEHGGWTYNADGSVRSAFEERPDLFSTVALWYQKGVATDQPEPPYGPARLPHGNAQQIEIERFLADAKTSKGKASVQKEVFWGKDLLFFEAAGEGARIDLPLDVPQDGRYEFVVQTGQAPDYGRYAVLVDGKVPGSSGLLEHEPGANVGSQAGFDGYNNEVFVGEDRVIAWPSLTKGRHTISFICTGRNAASNGYNLGLDGFILSRVAGSAGAVTRDSASAADPADRVRRLGERRIVSKRQLAEIVDGLAQPDSSVREASAWSLTQVGRSASAAGEQLGVALGDGDPVVRGLAAIALRNVEKLPDNVTDLLAAHLTDPDENVRMVSANALAAHGDAALRVKARLIAAAGVQGEHRHVLRAVALALGAIGQDAQDALPALRTLEQMPLVRWQAQWAIRAIEGK